MIIFSKFLLFHQIHLSLSLQLLQLIQFQDIAKCCISNLIIHSLLFSPMYLTDLLPDLSTTQRLPPVFHFVARKQLQFLLLFLTHHIFLSLDKLCQHLNSYLCHYSFTSKNSGPNLLATNLQVDFTKGLCCQLLQRASKPVSFPYLVSP